MPTEQLEFWKNENFRNDGCKTKRDTVWWYVHCLVTDRMLILENEGGWRWVVHDTINTTPHLFSNRALARQQAARLRQGTPKKYPWKY